MYGAKLGVTWRPSAEWFFDYSADAAAYARESGENHIRHRALIRLADGERYRFQTAFTFVQGPREGVEFDAGRSAWATVLVRERRQQIQNRTQLERTWTYDDWFIRPSAALTAFDLQARKRTDVAGYDNWIDRYDLAGGLDLGHQAVLGGELYGGWRYGRQYQGREGNRPTDRSNRYQRFLVGYKGDVTDQLQFKVETGPTYHRYEDSESVGDAVIRHWYLDASGTYRFSDSTRLTGVASQSKSVASTGLLSNEIRTLGVTLHHRFDPDWSLRLGHSYRTLLYDDRDLKDLLLTSEATLAWKLRPQAVIELSAAHETGRDASRVRNEAREFRRFIASIQASYRY